jgi:hypothetical protein
MAKFDSLQDHEFRRDEWAARERQSQSVRNTAKLPERRQYCARCSCSLTSTDYEAGRCTQCGYRLNKP